MKQIMIFLVGFIKTLMSRQNNPGSSSTLRVFMHEQMNDLQYEKNKIKTVYDGFDDRYPIKERHDNQLDLIRVYIQKMQILDTLKNKKISEKQRELIAIDYLEEMKSSKYAPNIFSGGLLDEWNDI